MNEKKKELNIKQSGSNFCRIAIYLFLLLGQDAIINVSSVHKGNFYEEKKNLNTYDLPCSDSALQIWQHDLNFWVLLQNTCCQARRNCEVCEEF